MWQIRRLDNRAGMSLIEILAALVVFTIGILTVAKVFPGGFGIVKQGEYATVANRLAQAQVEQLKNLSANLPAGIYCMIPSDNNCTPSGQVLSSPVAGMAATACDPANLNPLLDQNGKAYDAYYFSDINKCRHVEAESTEIPAPSVTAADGGSIYVPLFSPVICPDSGDQRPFKFWNPQKTSSTTTDPNNNHINVYSAPMERIPLPASGIPNLTGSFQYSIDYKAGMLYVVPTAYGYARSFVIKYSYWQDPGTGETPRLVSTTQTVSVPDCTVTPMPSYVSVTIPGLPTGGTIAASDLMVPGSDSLHRAFIRMYSREANNDPWLSTDTDPYEYKMLNPYTGILSFNPAGYGQTEMTTRGKIPLRAYVDYDVADWHIIREEHLVPASTSSISNPDPGTSSLPDLNVKLAIPFIKHLAGGAFTTASAYQGLYPSYLPYDVVVVDLSDGMCYGSTGSSVDQIPSTAQQASYAWSDKSSDYDAFKIDYAAGVIRCNPYFAGHTLRIHYKAEHNWGVQVYTAYNMFTRHI